MPSFTVVSSQPFLQALDRWQGLYETIPVLLVWIVEVAVPYNAWRRGGSPSKFCVRRLFWKSLFCTSPDMFP